MFVDKEAHRVFEISLDKIQNIRKQRTSSSLHKNLLVTKVLDKVRGNLKSEGEETTDTLGANSVLVPPIDNDVWDKENRNVNFVDLDTGQRRSTLATTVLGACQFAHSMCDCEYEPFYEVGNIPTSKLLQSPKLNDSFLLEDSQKADSFRSIHSMSGQGVCDDIPSPPAKRQKVANSMTQCKVIAKSQTQERLSFAMQLLNNQADPGQMSLSSVRPAISRKRGQSFDDNPTPTKCWRITQAIPDLEEVRIIVTQDLWCSSLVCSSPVHEEQQIQVSSDNMDDTLSSMFEAFAGLGQECKEPEDTADKKPSGAVPVVEESEQQFLNSAVPLPW